MPFLYHTHTHTCKLTHTQTQTFTHAHQNVLTHARSLSLPLSANLFCLDVSYICEHFTIRACCCYAVVTQVRRVRPAAAAPTPPPTRPRALSSSTSTERVGCRATAAAAWKETSREKRSLSFSPLTSLGILSLAFLTHSLCFSLSNLGTLSLAFLTYFFLLFSFSVFKASFSLP